MFRCFFPPRKGTQQKAETTYIVYNSGTEYQFGECRRCGFEDTDQIFISMMLDGEETFGLCPRCKARITRALRAEEIE